MNMKLRLTLVPALLASLNLFAATERPLWQIVNGKLDTNLGKNVKIQKNSGGIAKDGFLVLDGQNSGLVLRTPWYDPCEPSSITLLADVVFDKLPPKRGVIAANPKAFGVLAVEPSGKVSFTCAGALGKTLTMTGQTVLKTGTPYRLAGVIDNRYDNVSVLRLYVNGEVEAEGTLAGPPIAADIRDRRGFIGCSGFDGKKMLDPCPVRIAQVRYYWKPFTQTEICLMPGKPEFQNALVPLRSVFTKPLPVEVKGNAPFAVSLKAPAKGLTVDLVFSVEKLPAKSGYLWCREGFDSGLSLDKNGYLNFTIWNAEGDQTAVRSKKPIRLGQKYRARCFSERIAEETVITFVLDGVVQGVAAVPGKSRLYPVMVHFGGIAKNGKVLRGALDYRLYECGVWPVARRPNTIQLQ